MSSNSSMMSWVRDLSCTWILKQIQNMNFKELCRARRMTPQFRAQAYLAEDPDSVPSTQVDSSQQLSLQFYCPLLASSGLCTYTLHTLASFFSSLFSLSLALSLSLSLSITQILPHTHKIRNKQNFQKKYFSDITIEQTSLSIVYISWSEYQMRCFVFKKMFLWFMNDIRSARHSNRIA